MYYNWQAFGKIMANPCFYYVVPSYVKWTTVSNSMELTNMPRGLWGFLFSESRGMFTNSPVTLLAIIPSFSFFRQKQWHLLLFAVMAFPGILFMSAYSLWHGGNSIGYRHILPGAVILAMLSAFLVERVKGMALVPIFLLLAWSIVTGLAAFFIQVDPDLLRKTWKFEPADIHADFYGELMVPILTKMLRLVKGG
jgi:hypothetical protein